MMHSFTIICNQDSELGKITLISNGDSVQIKETKTFYFKRGHELKVLLCGANDNTEVVEMLGSQDFSLLGDSVCHNITIESDVEVQPIFRKKLGSGGKLGFLKVETTSGGYIEIFGEECRHHQLGDSIRTYPIKKFSTIQVRTFPDDEYEVDFIKSNNSTHETFDDVVFTDDAWIEVGFKKHSEQSGESYTFESHEELEPIVVEDEVELEISLNNLCKLTINMESAIGDVILVSGDDTSLVKETESFSYEIGSELKILLKTIDEYEIVEVLGSSDFSLMGDYVCHYIKLESDLEVTPIYRKTISNRGDLGFLKLETTSGGNVEIFGDECRHHQLGDSIRTYPIRKNSTIQIKTFPETGYTLDYIKSDYAKYETGQAVIFSEENALIEIKFKETDDVNLQEGSEYSFETMPSKLYSDKQTGIMELRNISRSRSSTQDSESTPTPGENVVVSNTYSFNFTPRHTPDLDGNYTVNGNPLHDIILYRNSTYEFTSLADRAAFEFLLPNMELYSDSNNEKCVFTQNESLLFTPTDETPNQLILRTIYRQDRVVRIHIMNSVFYGNAMSASYLTDSKIKFSDDLEQVVTDTNNLGEVVVSGKPSFTSLVGNLGADQVTSVQNHLEYTNSIGCTQLNALTTIFSEVYDTKGLDVHEINSLFTKVLTLGKNRNVCGDNPIKKILDGDLTYSRYHKVVILTDAMLNIGRVLGKYDLVKTKLADRYSKDRLVVFNGDEFLDEIFDKVVNSSVSETILTILKNLFSYVLNADVESAFYNWYKLFAFHYTFHQFYLNKIKDASDTEDTTELISEWDKFNDNLNTAFSSITTVSIPNEVVISECIECRDTTKNFNTLFDTMKITMSQSKYSDIVGNQTTLSENTFRKVYDRNIKVTYAGEESCYVVINVPVNYYDPLTSVDTYTLTYDYDNLSECINELVLDAEDSDEGEDDVEEELAFKFSMIESGNSYSMLDCEINKNDLMIENLGKGEYRIYIDQKISQGESLRTSPGYIKIPKEFATPIQQHYIRIGYRSGVDIQSISDIVDNRKNVRVVTTYWSQKMEKLVCVLDESVNIESNGSVTFSNSSLSSLDGTYSVSDVISDTVFSIDYTINEEDADDYDDITADIQINSGVKVYCNVSDFQVSDMVLFSGHKNYPTPIVDISSDEYGNYIVVDDGFENEPSYVVKSHAIEVRDEVIDFMHTQKQIYYETTESDYLDDRIWLTYDPDPDPNGRLNQKVSYIQLFYNKDF